MARGVGVFPLFPTPDEIVRSYLVTGERVIHVDKPALDAFVVIQIREVLLAVALFAFFLWALLTGRNSVVALVAFIAFDILLIWLIVQRLQAFYTRYVITTFRVIRVTGILTIRIESANEESGLQDLSDLKDPIRFNRILVEMINAKQGNVTPMVAAVIDD